MSERLTTPEVDAALNETYEALGVTRAGLAGLREVARSVASLRADARLGAALRAVLAGLASQGAGVLSIFEADGGFGADVTIHDGTTLLRTPDVAPLVALLAARTPIPETEER
jgi:hypothetical protein